MYHSISNYNYLCIEFHKNNQKMMRKIQFTKMEGAGNDYIYVDASRFDIPNPAEAAIRWSRPHTGIGSDGLILISRSKEASFRMRMYNNDGSEGMMCGNGIRCLGKFVYDHFMTRNLEFTVETKAGIKSLRLLMDREENVDRARVDMGEPVLCDPSLMATADGGMKEGLVTANGKTYCGTFVSMGNPHFVIFVPDVTKINLAEEGQALETNPLFPEKCNIEFAEVKSDGTLRTRVWERGSGITMACGTGACATAVAAVLCGKADRKSCIAMDGGNLYIHWLESDNHILLTGPATTVFEGEIEIND